MIGRSARSASPSREPSFTGIHATDDGILLSGATQAGTFETGIEAHAATWLATFRHARRRYPRG
jgi:hypothetical protein